MANLGLQGIYPVQELIPLLVEFVPVPVEVGDRLVPVLYLLLQVRYQPGLLPDSDPGSAWDPPGRANDLTRSASIGFACSRSASMIPAGSGRERIAAARVPATTCRTCTSGAV